ncbi:cytochrome c oxidase subunit 7A2b [Polymixia lowei]
MNCKRTARMFRQILALQQVSRRTIASTARRQVENKVPQKQKIFQEDNGMPVHLKGGSSDALLYRTTMVLTVLGAGYVVYELVKAAYPQKKE